jgi:hypothetical protein
MERRAISPRTVVAFVCVLVSVGVALILIQQKPASAAPNDCTLTVSGPFFYAGMVFPVIEVECDTVKRSIRIDAALDMDGSQVATSRRICRRTNHCVTGLASDGIFAVDVEGDQSWCGHGRAVIRTQGQAQLLPKLTSCESDTF